MNLRIRKKLSKRAVPILIDMRDGFRLENFHAAEKDESYHELDLLCRRRPDGSRVGNSLYAIKGTPMHGFTSYWGDDYEEHTAWSILREVVWWSCVDDGPRGDDGLPTFPLKAGVILATPPDYLREARRIVAERSARR